MHEQLNQCTLNEVTCVHGYVVYIISHNQMI